MLRASASRAFRASDDASSVGSDPAAPRGRRDAVHRLFRALHEGLKERIARIELSLRSASPGPREGLEPLRLSKERTLLDGLEIVLETPGASWRFVDTLTGTLRVDRIHEGRLEEVERLGVVRESVARDGEQEDGGLRGFRPVRKPSRSGAPFRHTSVAALIEELLGEAERRVQSLCASRVVLEGGASAPDDASSRACTDS